MEITIYNNRMVAIVIALLLIIVLSHPTTTTSAKPAPTAPVPAPAFSECFRALVNTSDCLSYVKVGSNLTNPDKACCPELAGLFETNPICLCELLSHNEAIDVHKALKLPSACGMPNTTTPTVSNCSALGVPVSLAPSSEDSMSPSDPPTRSASDETASSSSENKDNVASSIQAFALLFISNLFIVFVFIFF